MEDILYTVKEVAKLLKTNVDYVYKLHNSKVLRFMKVGKLKCRKETLEKFLARYDGYDISDPWNIHRLDEQEEEAN